MAVLGTTLSGIYSMIIFVVVYRFIDAKKQLAAFGIKNEILILAFFLYTFGAIKHGIGYYLTIESNYCKQTGVCEKLLDKTNPSSYLGFFENVWLENLGEGIIFVLVGLPVFTIMKYNIFAAFITGIMADLFAEYSGFHLHFCKSSCSAIPLVNI